jgi:broad specificity phosphatase PhoE
VRERDHGKDLAPQYLRDYFESRNPLTSFGSISEEEDDEIYYYTAPNGGESQEHVNQRIKHALDSLMSDYHKNTLVISHHLAVLGALNTIFSGTINTFHNLDNHRKPQNGSLTILSQIPQTQS